MSVVSIVSRHVRFGTRRVCSCFVLHGVLLVFFFRFSFIECASQARIYESVSGGLACTYITSYVFMHVHSRVLVCLSLYLSIKASLIKGKQVLREVEFTRGLCVLHLVILSTVYVKMQMTSLQI